MRSQSLPTLAVASKSRQNIHLKLVWGLASQEKHLQRAGSPCRHTEAAYPLSLLLASATCIRCGTRSGASSTGKARKRCILRVGPLQCWIIFLVLAGVCSRTLDRWPVSYQLKEVSHPGWIWSCRTSTTNLTLRSRGEKCC